MTVYALALITTLMMISVPIQAQDEAAGPAINHRQLADCMMRHMASNRLLSYNDAAKTCKDLLKPHKADTAANVAAKPAG
ncbi:MAG TPA: hypothetical protein VGI93_07665 [Steroidobacteraceae bacterium]|jgi:BarA-like signal transduction histidine kinase